MEKHILSKSTFIKGEQCLKALYLYKKRYFLRDKMPAERIATFTRGTRVGEMARMLFPGGIDCGARSPRQYAKAAEKTAKAVSDGVSVIYEACFLKHNTLVFLDILVKKDDGWHAYEVKSSLALSETYFKDAALQNYVIRESGLALKSFNLVHINADYVMEGDIDLHKAFVIQDVTDVVSSGYRDIGEKIKRQIEILDEAHSPKIEPGLHCRRPYDCDFIGFCWKNIPQKSVFALPSLSFEEKWDIYKKAGNDFERCVELLGENEIAKKQATAMWRNKTVIDKERLSDFLSAGDADKVFLKLLTFAPAIPLFENTKPYSHHIYGFIMERFDSGNKLTDSVLYISQNLESPHSETLTRLLSLLRNDDSIFYYDVAELTGSYDLPAAALNIKDLFSQGILSFPRLENYGFSAVYRAVTGKAAYFTKIMIDRQSANVYEKLYRNGFNSGEEFSQIETYLNEWAKYFRNLFFTLEKFK